MTTGAASGPRGVGLVLASFGLAAIYFLAAKLGLRLAFPHPSSTPVWPPTGIALAVFVLWGYRLWPGVFAGAFFANLTTAGSVATSLGIATGNTLEGVVGAALAVRFAGGRDAFDRAGRIVRWAFFTAGLASVVSATLGVGSLLLGGYAEPADAGRIWLTWWLGDAGSALIIAPFLILWARHPRTSPDGRTVVEALLAASSVLLLCGLVFGVPFQVGSKTYPLPFVFPWLAWIAFRLGPRATATAVVALSGLAIWGTLKGEGAFAGRAGNESLLLLQIFLAVSSATALAVAAAVEDRKRAERDLALLAAAVESSQDAITVVDRDGVVARWNKGAELLFGYRREEVEGRPIFTIIPEERAQEERALLARLFAGERVDHYETVRRRRDGTLLDVSLTLSPVKDADGRVVAASKIARDVTARKRAEEAERGLHKAQQEFSRLLELQVQARTAELRSALGELESFSSTVAHDLRAPLRALTGFSDLLLKSYEGRLDEEGRDFLRRIAAAARTMDALIQDLLAYSRVAREEIRLEAVPLDGLLEEILDAMAPELAERRASVRAEGTLPAVRAHRVMLRQALGNLVGNAVKFVEAGVTPDVRVRAERKGAGVRIWVQDNGIGIAPEHHERIFEIFQRLSPGRYAGTGVGLAIVRKAISRMGGASGVESSPGLGSRFWIELPAADLIPADAGASETPAAPGA